MMERFSTDEEQQKIQLLFVCTGNTCRSPMAELVCADMTGTDNVKSVSAGLYAFDGDAMSENSLAVLAESGIDGNSFRSRPLSFDLVRESSLILTMTAAHRAELLMRYPDAAGKCFTLLEKSGGGDVSDPFGQNIAVYRHTLGEIRRGIAGWIEFFNNFYK